MNDFVTEENALLRKTIRNITKRIYDQRESILVKIPGWDAAIDESLKIIHEETGLRIDEILNPKCN